MEQIQAKINQALAGFSSLPDLAEIIILLLVTSFLTFLFLWIGHRRRLKAEREKYQELEKSHNNLSTEHEALAIELVGIRDERDALDEELVELRVRVEDAEDELVRMSSVENQLTEALAYKVRYENIKINYDQIKEQVAEMDENIQRMETKIASLQGQLAVAKAKAERKEIKAIATENPHPLALEEPELEPESEPTLVFDPEPVTPSMQEATTPPVSPTSAEKSEEKQEDDVITKAYKKFTDFFSGK